jgi:hypothetical protein
VDTILNRVSAISAAVTALAFVGAISHELGFFRIVGFEFLVLSTPSDYISAAMSWLPYAVAWLFICAFVSFVFTDLFSEKKSFSVSYKRNKAKIISKILAIMYAISLLVLVLVRPIVSLDVYISMIISMYIIWYLTNPSSYLSNNPNINPLIAPSILLFVLFISLSYNIGSGSALKDVNIEQSTTLMEAQGETRQGKLLRAYDKGILFHEKGDGGVIFVRWEEVKKIRQVSGYADQPSLICRWWPGICPDQHTVRPGAGG